MSPFPLITVVREVFRTAKNLRPLGQKVLVTTHLYKQCLNNFLVRNCLWVKWYFSLLSLGAPLELNGAAQKSLAKKTQAETKKQQVHSNLPVDFPPNLFWAYGKSGNPETRSKRNRNSNQGKVENAKTQRIFEDNDAGCKYQNGSNLKCMLWPS